MAQAWIGSAVKARYEVQLAKQEIIQHMLDDETRGLIENYADMPDDLEAIIPWLEKIKFPFEDQVDVIH